MIPDVESEGDGPIPPSHPVIKELLQHECNDRCHMHLAFLTQNLQWRSSFQLLVINEIDPLEAP